MLFGDYFSEISWTHMYHFSLKLTARVRAMSTLVLREVRVFVCFVPLQLWKLRVFVYHVLLQVASTALCWPCGVLFGGL